MIKMSTITEIKKLIVSRRDACLDVPMRDACKEMMNLLGKARNHLYWMIQDVDYRKEGTGIAAHDSDDLRDARDLLEKITTGKIKIKCELCGKVLPPLRKDETKCESGYLCRQCAGLGELGESRPQT